MGETIYMMTSPEQITAAYKNTTTLSWIEHLDQLLMKFGFQKSSLYKLWQEPCEGDPRYDNPLNPKHKSLGAYTQDLLRQQFLSADKLDDIGGKMLRLVDDSLLLKNLPIDKSGNQVPLPLWDLCARILMDGTTRSWFGNLMHDIEPTFTQLQINCIEEMWKIIMFPYPKFAAKRLHTSLEKARGALLKYIRMPKDVRKEETWLMTKLLDEHKAAGVEDGNIVSVILMMFGV